MHYSVMPDEVIHYLAVRPDGCYLEATAGLGGHTEAIARRLTTGRLIASDRDGESLERARRRLEPWRDRVVFEQARFSELEQRMERLGIGKVDGVLADLGASYAQLTEPERGFSFMADGPLDCRYDRSQGMTAAELINHISETELADLIFKSGGERRARRQARAIVRARPIRSTRHLASVIESVAPRARSRLHPATKTFMALRVEINQELQELEALLAALPRLVSSRGRVVILTFMSSEDRIVKHGFRSLARAGGATLLTKHVVRPAEEEIRENPPSRSAKLRALEVK